MSHIVNEQVSWRKSIQTWVGIFHISPRYLNRDLGIMWKLSTSLQIGWFRFQSVLLTIHVAGQPVMILVSFIRLLHLYSWLNINSGMKSEKIQGCAASSPCWTCWAPMIFWPLLMLANWDNVELSSTLGASASYTHCFSFHWSSSG